MNFDDLDTDDLMDLLERLRDLGAASVTLGAVAVTFRPDAPRAVPVELAAPETPHERPTPAGPPKDLRGMAAAAFGALTFPGQRG